MSAFRRYRKLVVASIVSIVSAAFIGMVILSNPLSHSLTIESFDRAMSDHSLQKYKVLENRTGGLDVGKLSFFERLHCRIKPLLGRSPKLTIGFPDGSARYTISDGQNSFLCEVQIIGNHICFIEVIGIKETERAAQDWVNELRRIIPQAVKVSTNFRSN